MTVGTAKDPNLAAQIVIAREKGFFKDAGLNATISYFPSGGDLMAAIVGANPAKPTRELITISISGADATCASASSPSSTRTLPPYSRWSSEAERSSRTTTVSGWNSSI